MLTKRKKLSKKEIKEDKLITAYYKVYNFVEENRNRLLTYAGALVVIVLVVIFFINNRNKNNDEAGVQLALIMNSYDSGNYLEAIEGRAGTKLTGLKKIVDQYGSTENGEIAKVYLANAYEYLGKTDDAFKYYDSYSGSNKLFKATALAGEAGYESYKKNYEKAGDLYKKAGHVSSDNVLNPEYLLNAGINYMKVGKNAEAKELFDKIKKDYTNSTAMREVERYSIQLE